MARKPTTYTELEQRVKGLEEEASERERREVTLGEFLEFKEKIISESPIGMSIYDASGQCVAANDSIGELVGATREQVLEQNYNKIGSWKESGLLSKAKSAIRENSKKRHELKVESTFGKDVSLDCHLVPFSSEGQKHLLLMINDISERMRAEEALRESEEKVRALLNASTESVFLMNNKGVILALNETMAQRLGKSVDELLGMNVYDLLPAKISKQRKRRVDKVIRSRKPLRFEDKRDGRVMDNSVYPVFDERGRVEQLAIYGRDITCQKQAENELRRREATLKIQKEKLQEANTMLKVLLKQIEKNKIELEERVLLNVRKVANLYIERLRKSRLNEEQMAYLNILESNLNNIVAPLAHKLSSKYLGLTPSEIQTAHLVKDGKSTKEIADVLKVSPLTIESRRKNIRMKLDINNKRVNLRTYLLSM
jgi:PAS domain S-box-containing protein